MTSSQPTRPCARCQTREAAGLPHYGLPAEPDSPLCGPCDDFEAGLRQDAEEAEHGYRSDRWAASDRESD